MGATEGQKLAARVTPHQRQNNPWWLLIHGSRKGDVEDGQAVLEASWRGVLLHLCLPTN